MRPNDSILDGVGYRGLLNLTAPRLRTVFLSDFDIGRPTRERIRHDFAAPLAEPVFVRIDRGLGYVRRQLAAAAIDASRDYLSLQAIVTDVKNVQRVEELYDSVPRRDLARLELPLRESGFQPRFARKLLKIVMKADYAQQRRFSYAFFSALAKRKPYTVTIRTRAGELEIADRSAWFDLAGPLEQAEKRILPGGEVAYTGSRISGSFVVDGAILASPQDPAVAGDARRIGRWSRELQQRPLRFDIDSGRISAIHGKGRAASVVRQLCEADERYRAVTEVGISFNMACDRFVHSWPASSNEGRPGVHIALGGDPDPETEQVARPLVHIDFMAANVTTFVNGRRFLTATS